MSFALRSQDLCDKRFDVVGTDHRDGNNRRLFAMRSSDLPGDFHRASIDGALGLGGHYLEGNAVEQKSVDCQGFVAVVI